MPSWVTLGWIIALLVLIGAFVLAIVNRLPYEQAILIGGLAAAFLLERVPVRAT